VLEAKMVKLVLKVNRASRVRMVKLVLKVSKELMGQQAVWEQQAMMAQLV
jgi:hypothetical protein